MKVNIEKYIEMQSSIFWKENNYIQYNEVAKIITANLSMQFNFTDPVYIPIPSNMDPQIPRVQINGQQHQDNGVEVSISVSNIAVTISVNTIDKDRPGLVDFFLESCKLVAIGLVSSGSSFNRMGIVFRGYNNIESPTKWICDNYIKDDVVKDGLVEAGIQLVYRFKEGQTTYNDLTNYRLGINNTTSTDILLVEKDINIANGDIVELNMMSVVELIEVVKGKVYR